MAQHELTQAWRDCTPNGGSCYKEALVGRWETDLDRFQKLLVLRCLRQVCAVEDRYRFTCTWLHLLVLRCLRQVCAVDVATYMCI